MGLDKNGYYSLRDILGYNAKYNLVLSDRGRGKTVEGKRHLMQSEGTSMCLYRQQPDMASARTNWADTLVSLLDQYKMEDFGWDGSDKEGWYLTYQGEPKVWFRYLTQVNHIKQEVFPDDMNWVWMDEFIPMAYRKLAGVNSEGDAIRTVMKTIEHDTVHTREEKGLKPLRFIGFANPFTWNNPLLGYFGVLPVPGIHRVNSETVCELIPPAEGSANTDEIDRNMGWMNESSFVAPVPKNAVPFESMRIDKKFFVVYEYQKQYYIKETNGHGNIARSMYFNGIPRIMRWGTLEGLTEDELCIENYDHLRIWKKLVYAGKIYYANLNTKFNFIRNI